MVVSSVICVRTEMRAVASLLLAGKIDYLLLLFDSVVILACLASLVLCARSVITGIQLQFVSSREITN